MADSNISVADNLSIDVEKIRSEFPILSQTIHGKPLIYLDNPDYRTVTLGLEYFRSPYVDNRHLLMTGAVLAMAPVAILFLVFQRFIVAGISTTGLKG